MVPFGLSSRIYQNPTAHFWQELSPTILSRYKSETKQHGHALKKNRRRTANAIGIKRMPEAITGNHPTYAPKQAMKQAIWVMMPTNFWSAGEKLGAGVCGSGGTPSL
jgi:hypothetical protein